MDILQVNSFYPFTNATGEFHYPFGGQEAVVLSVKRILEDHGHTLIFFAMKHPEDLKCEHSEYFVPYINLRDSNGVLNKMRTSGRILYSFEARRRLSKLLNEHNVDIAHLHSINHHLSPSILVELKKRKIPIVMTLHHFKIVCASYYLLVGGKSCEACQGGRYYMAVKNSCVRGSRAKSILCALEMYLHHAILDIYNNVDIFISPSVFLIRKFKEMGFKREIIHLPNFVDEQKLGQLDLEKGNNNIEKENSIVYFGRLSSEKGLGTLLDAAKLLLNNRNERKIEIKIIGEGAMSEELRHKVTSEKIDNVRFLGYLKGTALFQEIAKSLAVVLPSECYENNPISVLEAFALSIPVIGANIAGIPELVRDKQTGLTFEPGNAKDLAAKINCLISNNDEINKMGENARYLIEHELSKEKHYEKLMAIYKKAITGSAHYFR